MMTAALLRQQAVEALAGGEIPRAVECLRAAIRLQPDHAAWHHELAECHWAAYEFNDALECYAHALRDAADPVGTCTLAAKKLFGIARFREAAVWMERAVAHAPEDAALRTMLGEVCERGHQLSVAETHAQHALALAPDNPRAVRLLAHIERRRGAFDQARQRLAQQLARCPGPEDWRLRYELAAVLDRIGEYDLAFHELLAAKEQLRPQAMPFLARAETVKRRQSEIARQLSREDYVAWSGTPASPHRPIAFLCGHPRSGTTLLEQILDAHDDVIGTDETGILAREFIDPIAWQAASADDAVRELRGLDAAQLAAGRETYRRLTEAHLGEAIGSRLLVEKEPTLTPDLPLPLRLFPEAKVIFPLRDPRDVCVSYFFTLVPLATPSAPAVDLRSTLAACAHSLSLWSHWKKTLPGPCREVRYETLVTQPEGETRRLMEFLGLPWSEKLLAFHEQARTKEIRTPTYADAAQPLYQRAIGRWRHYEKYLTPHLEILRPHLRAFGYEA